MGGLAHYIEDEGISTTQISLIREHTERIKPPRALWVSFDLGRPLGTPNDAPFQRSVLEHALKLFESPSGPVLEDFPHDAPDMVSAAGFTHGTIQRGCLGHRILQSQHAGKLTPCHP